MAAVIVIIRALVVDILLVMETAMDLEEESKNSFLEIMINCLFLKKWKLE